MAISPFPRQKKFSVCFCLFVMGWGGLLFFFIIIPVGSWGKMSTGTLSCLLLQLQYWL